VKSREEYEASIFAKRDALVAKRKKNMRITASALSVMICLGAAAVAMPMLKEKPDETQVLPVTNAAGGVTENKIVAETYGEIATYPANYDTGIAYTNQHNFAYHNDFCIESVEGEVNELPVASTTEIYQIPDGEIAVESGESEEKPDSIFNQIVDDMGGFRPESPDGAFDAMAEKPTKKNYTTEEIVAEAKKHISDADEIIDSKTNVTVSRNANGTTTYTAYFYTESKRITVELDSELRLIEVKEKDNIGNAVQITPGYNPDEE